MAVCTWCDLEMSTVTTCSVVALHRDGKVFPRVPYGKERRRGLLHARDGKCHDCGVVRGGLHHLGCDEERCPRCGDQLFSGCCLFDEDHDMIVDDEDLFDRFMHEHW